MRAGRSSHVPHWGFNVAGRGADDVDMALALTRRHGQPLRLVTPDGSVALVTVQPGHQPGEVRVLIDAPGSIVVERPERDS
jgi:hypothetical protein